MPLLLAPVEGNTAIVEALSKVAANTEDEEGCWPTLHSAAGKGLKAIVGALLVTGADKEAKDEVKGGGGPGRVGAGSVWFVLFWLH